MTNGRDELAEIRAVLAQVAQQQVVTQQIVDSNARAIESNSAAIAENTQSIARLEQSITALTQRMDAGFSEMVQMMTQLAEEAAADRAELRRMIEAMYGNQGNGSGEG